MTRNENKSNRNRSLVVLLVLCAMLSVTLIGCKKPVEENPAPSTSEVESEVISEEVSEEISEEMTIEEKIASEMPQKLEVGENEVIVPETVTAEQIMTRMKEIEVTGVEYAEDINKENLAGLLVLNCSYMDSNEFDSLVDEYYGSTDELISCFDNYCNYLSDDNYIYGNGSSVLPEELFFDEYLINQAEQISYLIKMYQSDTENSKVYYDILVDYLFDGQNEYMTFDYKDPRLEGSGLAGLQIMVTGKIYDGITMYNPELRSEGVLIERDAEFREEINVIISQRTK